MAEIDDLREDMRKLAKEMQEMRQDFDEQPRYFGRRFSNALVSPNFQAGKRGYRFGEDGRIDAASFIAGDTSSGRVEFSVDTLGDALISIYDTSGILSMRLGGLRQASIRLYDTNADFTGFIQGTENLADVGGGVTLRVSDTGASESVGTDYEFSRDHFRKAITDTATLGSSGSFWERTYTDRLMLTDGRAEPDTASGTWDTSGAVIYIDSADGDLKIKFIDGVVKTIVTDTA